jgi:predicted permease
VIFIELLMPLAVANVNLSSLYDCIPKTVTALVFISSVLFLAVIFAAIKILPFLS